MPSLYDGADIRSCIVLHITKKHIFLLVKLLFAAVIFIALRLCPCPDGLSDEAMMFLAIFITAIYCMTVNIIKDYVILITALALTAALGAAEFETVFSAFSGKTVWLLIGAFGIGAAITKCGLMSRIAFLVLKPFPKNFKGQVLALFTMGSILLPLVPSNSAKSSLLSPFAKALSDENGYAYRSPGAVGFFAASALPCTCTTFGFFSSTSLIVVAVGLMPPEFAAGIHWLSWLKYSIFWFIFVSAALYAAIIAMYHPKEQTRLTDEFIDERLKSLGPMTTSEKRAAVILVLTLAAWITESIHGISTTLVALFALVAYHAAGVLDSKTFRTGVAWESIIMSGGIVCTSNLFSSLGISSWLADVLYPYIQVIISNIYIFIPLLALLVYAVRSIVISQTASLTIFYVIFGSSAVAAGIHPWIVVFILLTSGAVFYLPFQNTTYLAAYGAAGHDMAAHSDLRKLSFVYMAVNVAGLMLSTFWWHLTGIL